MQTARNYSLTGPESLRAIESGLANAQWYQPPIDRGRLNELTARTDLRACRDTLLWLVLLVGTGLAAWYAIGSWWAVPAFAVYGALYGGAADSRWHEMGHGTAFRSSWLNDLIYYPACFMLLRGPTLWRWSHVRHHTDTIIVGRDPEIIFPRPPTPTMVLSTFCGLRVVFPMLRRHLRHAAGRVDDDAKQFVPTDQQRRLVWESRAFIAILAAVAVWCVVAGTIVPALYIGLPSIYGAWLLVFFGLTQHAGLREDVLDHRLNSRTVYMNPIFRFLYSNMNYHVEHHIFPTVPYHALPALHAEIKDHLAPALPNSMAAYREIVSTLARQRHDPNWELTGRAVPEAPASERAVVQVGASLWSARDDQTRDDPRSGAEVQAPVVADAVEVLVELVDLGPATTLEVGAVRPAIHDGRLFALYRLSNDEYALTDGVCTHGQAELTDGVIIDCTIECPKHNGRFDIRTGRAVRRPATKPITTYDIENVDGRLLSRLVAQDHSTGDLATGSPLDTGSLKVRRPGRAS